MKCHRSFFFFLFSLLLAPLLRAERTYQIIFFQRPASVPEEVQVYVNGEAGERLEIPNNRFSENHTLEGDGEISLVFADKVYEDLKLIKPFPHAKIGSGWNKFLILAFHDPENSHLPIKFVTMNASTSEFGLGDFRFINFSDAGFAGALGSKELKIQPKHTVTFKDFAKHNTEFRMKINSYRPDENKKLKARPFANKLLRYNKNNRTLFFIYSPNGSKRLTYRAAEVRGL